MAAGRTTVGAIQVRGARVHNLKNIDVTIPRECLVVVTGLSGSGKSTLAFDTLYAEGQRRYVESLSTYARQFLEQMPKPDCDAVDGLSPAIAIEQKGAGRNPRSTVGTVTEIADHLRLLFARVGQPYCWSCDRPISAQTVSQVVDRLMALPADTRMALYAPVVRDRKGEHKKELDDLRRAGFVRVRVDGELRDLSDEWSLARTQRHTIEVVVDRLQVKPGIERRLADSLEVAFERSGGVIMVETSTREVPAVTPILFSTRHACPACGTSYPELAPRLFSFNSPHGACATCSGLGVEQRFDESGLIVDPQAPIGRALAPTLRRALPQLDAVLLALSKAYRFSLDTPFADLPEAARHAVLRGTGDQPLAVTFEQAGRTREVSKPFQGLLAWTEKRHREGPNWQREQLQGLVSERKCHTCLGTRLRREANYVRIGARSIVEVSGMTVTTARTFLEGLSLGVQDTEIARPLLKEIAARLQFLADVGVEYLSLDRSAVTLSGGEAQRVRLATQIGSRLTGVLYVLDEPSIGLHPRDTERLLGTLITLRDLGNTVVVVEHDREVIERADHIIDMGPGAGVHGGSVVAAGTPGEIAAHPTSLTGQYLSGRLRVPVPTQRRRGLGFALTIKGARENNLRSVDLSIPLGTVTCVTGVSGSGKSTLVVDTLYRAVARKLGVGRDDPGTHDDLTGWQLIDKVIEVSQAPIGRTPRSNPATYTGVFGPIRELFAQLPDARTRGFGPGRFSFNVKGGRCEACSGDGLVAIEMHFLPDVYVTCEVCNGRRYDRETLEVKFKGLSIADVLDLTVGEALDLLAHMSPVRRSLEALREVGLDYIRLGQAANTLSGGEAQRVKLAKELARRATGRTLYVLDEPTTGLHFEDVRRLLEVLHRLVDAGNTVLMIEHNLDVIRNADWVVDLGPGGGAAGGTIVAQGTPEDVARQSGSATGECLARLRGE
jgi:excinuclease ABC subunit A